MSEKTEIFQFATKESFKRFINGFQHAIIYSAMLIFMFSAGAKIFSVWKPAKLLLVPDPFFPFITEIQLFVIAAIMELTVAGMLLQPWSVKFKLSMVNSLSSMLLIYRLGLRLLHAPPSYCPCLGNFWEAIGISDLLVTQIALFMAWFLFLGSLCGLLTLGQSTTS